MRHILFGLNLVFLFLILGVAASCSDSGATPDGEAQGCTIDEECAGFPDELCISNKCLSITDGDFDLTDGDIVRICLTDLDCPPGEFCIEETCKPPIEDGDFTDGDYDVELPEDLACPDISVEPDELDFGSVQIGNSVTRSFAIRNDSNTKVLLTVYDINYNQLQTSEYEIITELPTPDEPIVLERGEAFGPIEVKYSPIDEGIDEAQISIVSDDCDESLFHLPLKSQYKGDAQICVEPVEYDFGDLELGAPALEKTFEITNCPKEAGGNKVLVINDITMASGANPHFTITEGMINPLDPVHLVPDRPYYFTVRYQPQWLADYFDPHRERILIVNQSDTIGDRLKEVYVQGMASSQLMSVVPFPIEFGDVTVTDDECTDDSECPRRHDMCLEGGECGKELDIAIYNWSGNPEAIEQLVLTDEEGGNGCRDFTIVDNAADLVRAHCNAEDGSGCVSPLVCELRDPDIPTSAFCHIAPGMGTPGLFKLQYKPGEVGQDNNCVLRVFSTLAGMDFLSVPIHANGRPPNVCPTARVALQSHGPPIITPVEGIPEDTKLCFYGNISYDPDGEIVAFNWRMEDMPEGSTADDFFFLDSDHINMCTTFDLAGDYHLQLSIQDDEGCWSDPANVFVTLNGNQGLGIRLDFEGGSTSFLGSNQVDMDLYVTSPSGGSCSDNNVNANNTCLFPLGNGVAIMTAWSHGAGTGSTTEEMRIGNPVDGPWTVGARYVNDCDGWYDFLVQPFCASHHKDNDFTIKFTDPNNWSSSAPLFPDVSGRIRVGGSKEWRLIRRDGVFESIQVVN